MTVAERGETDHAYLVTCQNHLHSAMALWGVKAETKLMKGVLYRTFPHIGTAICVSLDTHQIYRAATTEFQFSGEDLHAEGKSASESWAIHK
jgi:hypothetical protein